VEYVTDDEATAVDWTTHAVPPPVGPGHTDAWYAPGVCEQYEVHPGVVVTVEERKFGFEYLVREPELGPMEAEALATVRAHFSAVQRRRPLTREGTVARAQRGLEPKYRRVLDRLLDGTPAGRRRIEYYTLRDLRLLDELTPLALDERVEVVDVGDTATDRLVIHTADYAPATTTYAAESEFTARVAGERLSAYTVPFAEFDVEVVVYREHLLGDDRFTTKYAVLEPDLLPGDEELVEECKERIWEANVDEVIVDRETFVRRRARQFLSRRLTARNTRAWLDALEYRLRGALAAYDLAVPPVDSRYAEDRLDDLVYYVLRDYVGEGILTVPIRDPRLEDVEANRVGERVKVIPRGVGGRVPTNLTFADETEFVNVVTQLAAADGTELSASVPSAKVNLSPPGVDETIRCAVALPVISEDGPHVSIRKQAAEPMTPVSLVASGALSTELVTLLWLAYEHHRVVLFSGPTGVGKTTLMNAHMPFIPYDHRPISIDEGSREVRLPHETGVSLTTRDHESEHKRVTMADLMTEANYLNPDVEIIAEINTPASFQTFAETLNTGHGVIGTTHAEDVETLVNRVIEQGLPAYLLREIDLVVFPHHVDGERYVSSVVEFVTESEYRTLEARGGAGRAPEREHGVIEKGGSEMYWNTVTRRTPAGDLAFDYHHPGYDEEARDVGHYLFHRVARATDRPVDAVEAEFHRKHRYVQYLVEEGVETFAELFDFISDLRIDEAATVERVRRGRLVERADAGGSDERPPGADESAQATDDEATESRPEHGATNGSDAAGGAE
jgi:type IV secretory pathway ATPase VirB11/archaellum biosynthesis ATPase